MRPDHRIGLVVPSSNVTMETEIPQIFESSSSLRHSTFHSSRATLHTVDKESLTQMLELGDDCAASLADAQVDVIAYACLIAVMAQGPKAHEWIEPKLSKASGGNIPVTSSAGALVRQTQRLGLKRIALLAPYVPTLTEMAINYLESYGINVIEHKSLGVDDNLAVGRLDPTDPLRHVRSFDFSNVDGLIISACVQMPSLESVDVAENELGIPVLSAATATTREIVDSLGVQPDFQIGGSLLTSTR